MKTPLTFLLALTFLFLYPSISLSQTFKCEFVSEKFEGGKSNKRICSGNPEIVFSFDLNPPPRNKHCKVGDIPYDYLDFNVDLDKKIITYLVRGQDGELLEFDFRYRVSSVEQFTQRLNNRYTGEKTTNYLITFTATDQFGNEEVNTLFIPKNEKSILSSYESNLRLEKGSGSWIHMKFGTCVNTSK